MERTRRLLSVAVLCALAACPLATNARAQHSTLRGFVSDGSTGRALEGANAVLTGEDGRFRGAVAGRDGLYQIDEIAPGRHVLTVSFVGYRPHADTLTFEGRSVRTYSVELDPSEESLDEIVVSTGGDKAAAALGAGRQRVTGADIARIPTPAGSGDLASYLQAMPGVVSLGDRGGQLFIRGGTPSQNLVLLDGMLVYRPFHILGFFSAFPEDLVASADVYAGGFDARYSGRISSVIDIATRGGNLHQFEADAALSPFVSSLRVEGPLSKGNLSLLTSMRLSTVERAAPTLTGRDVPIGFSDVFVKLHHAGANNARCSLAALRTYDRGRMEGAGRPDFRWSNTVFGGRCIAVSPGSDLLMELVTFFSAVSNSVGVPENPERTADTWRFAARADFALPTRLGRLRWGFSGHSDRIRFELGEKFQGFRTGSSLLVGASAYVGLDATPGRVWTLTPGLALQIPLDYSAVIEPRLRVSWRPGGSEMHEFSFAAGVYHQIIEGVTDERDAGSFFTAWIPAPLHDRKARAEHVIAGWHGRFGRSNVSLESYFKLQHDIPVPIWSTVAHFTTELTPADGTTYGADARLELDLGRLYMYLGYGYSWTRYSSAQGDFSEWFGEAVQTYHPPQDRRHQLHAIATLDLKAFELQIRWQLGSGLPFTGAIGYDALVNLHELRDVRVAYGQPRFLYEKPYRSRLPAYHRLDVGLSRRFNTGPISLTLDVGAMNVYDRRNLFYFDLLTLERVDQLPIIPYASLRITL